MKREREKERTREGKGESAGLRRTFASTYAIGIISCRAKSVFHIIPPSTSFAAVNHETRVRKSKRSSLLLNRDNVQKGNVFSCSLAASADSPRRSITSVASKNLPALLALSRSRRTLPPSLAGVSVISVGPFPPRTAISASPRADSSGVISKRGDTDQRQTDTTAMHVPVSVTILERFSR